MIVIKLDEKCLDECSHVEIRKRKDGIAVVKVPKARTIYEIPAAETKKNMLHWNQWIPSKDLMKSITLVVGFFLFASNGLNCTLFAPG